jgi:hypothetical protein
LSLVNTDELAKYNGQHPPGKLERFTDSKLVLKNPKYPTGKLDNEAATVPTGTFVAVSEDPVGIPAVVMNPPVVTGDTARVAPVPKNILENA